MPQLTLICGADPRTCENGPAVRLASGRWKIECDGVKDTAMFLSLITGADDPETISVQHDSEFQLDKPYIVQIGFRNRGQERYVTVSVRKIA